MLENAKMDMEVGRWGNGGDPIPPQGYWGLPPLHLYEDFLYLWELYI